MDLSMNQTIMKPDDHHMINLENVTLDGLQHWLKHEYQHLGWMALALSMNHPEKPYAYYMSLNRLEKAIKERICIDNSNAQVARDFVVLSENLTRLKDFAKKLGITEELKPIICAKQDGGSIKKMSKKSSKKGSKSKKESKKGSKSKKIVKKNSKKNSKKSSKKVMKMNIDM